MGTEKFMAFKEDGTAYRLKGRILRFLDAEPVSSADKSNMRSSLGITSQGGLGDLLAANNLSDVSNAATSRTNLSVNSIAEDAEANGTKLLGPSVYFDGTNDVVTVADDAKLSFTDGTDDIPFTTSAWAYIPDPTKTFYIVGKWGTGGPTQEWLFATNTSGQIRVSLGDGTSSFVIASTNTIPQAGWYHFALTYSGSGPNSSNTFDNASSGVKLFINGIESATSGSTTGYTGQSNTSQTVRFGAASNLFSAGSLRSAQIFNRELTASEVADLAKGNELGFSDEWGGALGGTYTSDFTSDSTNGWTAYGGSANATTTVGGDADVLQLTIDSATANHQLLRTQLDVGKNYRVTAEVYIPSTNASVDSVEINSSATGGTNIFATTTTQNAWTAVSGESIAGATSLRIRMKSGSSYVFAGNGTDYIAIRNVKITEIGTLADFRSERFDSSTNKWYDLSDNAFVGTNSGASLAGREIPIYETGTWTPTLTFGGASASMTYSAQEGYYTRIGDTVFVSGVCTISAVGSSQGTARVASLPFISRNMTSTSFTTSSVAAFDMTGLTSAVTALIEDNQPNAILYDGGATGSTAINHSNFTATSSIRFSATYQIQ
jgi:hypothetical protein